MTPDHFGSSAASVSVTNIKAKSGTCVGIASNCESTPCSVHGSIRVQNTFCRPLVVIDTTQASFTLPVGGISLITVQNASGSGPRALACDHKLGIKVYLTNPNGSPGP